MANGNGKVIDEGLMALKAAFDGAKFLDADAKACSELMMLGKHRERQIPDNVIMEIYGMITEGSNVQLKLDATADGDVGFIANLESYADMAAFMQGTFEAIPTGDHSRAN